MKILDFANSYYRFTVPPQEDKRKPGHKPWGNSARIQFDARCTIIREDTGVKDEFYFVAPCRTEWMYRERGLFQMPSEEFCGIWSNTRHRIIKTRSLYNGNSSNSVPTTKDIFTESTIIAKELGNPRILHTDMDVVNATLENLPIISRTEIRNLEKKLLASVEYPVKTMNYHEERGRFQVDTGPIIVPDLDSKEEHWIDWFSVAQVVYNTFDWAEFIFRGPVQLIEDGKHICTLSDYSETKGYDVKNTLVCPKV